MTTTCCDAPANSSAKAERKPTPEELQKYLCFLDMERAFLIEEIGAHSPDRKLNYVQSFAEVNLLVGNTEGMEPSLRARSVLEAVGLLGDVP